MATQAYAGVGSRQSPPAMLLLMESIGDARARAGWTLRTGGSPGADQAFLRGACAGHGAVELFLPWPGFAPEGSREGPGLVLSALPSERAHELAAGFHPRWAKLSDAERALLARDCEEVLGADLQTPAAELICWTADGSLDGEGLFDDGTGQALRVAHRAGITVLNLARPESERQIRRSLARRG